LQFLHAVLRLVAGDQAGIDGADGGADHPVRPDTRFVQRLVHAGLVGAERAAALQDENVLAETRRRLSDHVEMFL